MEKKKLTQHFLENNYVLYGHGLNISLSTPMEMFNFVSTFCCYLKENGNICKLVGVIKQFY